VDPSKYKPSPVQQEFHLCSCREVLFAGAAGPGKTLALLWDPIITQALGEAERWKDGEIHQSDGWAILFRRTMPRLLEILKRAHQIIPVVFPGSKWDGDNKMYITPFGYRFQYAQIQHEADADNFRSSEFTWIGFDEATEFEKYQFDILSARLRTSDPVLRTKLRVRLATNPAPGWVKERYVDPHPNGRKRIVERLVLSDGEVRELDRVFIPATLYDNPDAEFRKDYEANLLSKPAHIREAWLKGNWNFIDGAYFANDFNRAIHVCKPFSVENGYTKYRSIDWGHKTFGTVLWWAMDGDGNLVCYHEYNFKGKTADEVALDIREIEMTYGDWNEARNVSRLTGPADWQIWEERGTTGPTIAETMGIFGVGWDKCSKGRKSAAMELMRRLTMPIESKDDVPNIRWFDTCTKCIEQIPSVPVNKSDPEEPIKDGTTHWLDATFYGIMWRAALPVTKTIDPSKHFDELEKKRQQKVHKRGAFGY